MRKSESVICEVGWDKGTLNGSEPVVAEPYNVRSAFHGAADVGPVSQSASASLQIVIPNFGVQEWTKFPDAGYEVVSGVCEMKSGSLYPNEAPGIGVDVDEQKAARYPYQAAYMPIVRRADGSMHVY